jgi:hypothetical protein
MKNLTEAIGWIDEHARSARTISLTESHPARTTDIVQSGRSTVELPKKAGLPEHHNIITILSDPAYMQNL